MSSGTCRAVFDGGDSCSRPSGHPGDHFEPVPDKAPADPSIPDSVRTRVRLHAAQTEYDLTVLKNRLDCMPTVTNVSKELRRKREQLTAELDAWKYLSRITHTRMD